MKVERDFILKDEFISDLSEAMNWYRVRGNKLADELYSDAQTILTHIQFYPESFSVTIRNFRQAVMGRFPYVIVYKIYKTEIVVYSFFHTSRNPSRKFKRK